MSRNEEQIAFWNGEAGDRWVAAQEGMDRTLGPLGEAALAVADLRPGMRVLDVGCGCGETTLALAAAVGPNGRVTGLDISAPMLARARARALLAPQAIDFALADAATAALPTADRIFSRFGVMFFDEPIAAFHNLHDALVPGGRIAFVCWQALANNPWARLPLEAVTAVLGPPERAPAPDAPGPFAFADRDRVHHILAEARFTEITTTGHVIDLSWGTATDDASLRETFVRIGPAARRLADAPEALREAAITAILERIRPFVRPGALVLPAAIWVVTAQRNER